MFCMFCESGGQLVLVLHSLASLLDCGMLSFDPCVSGLYRTVVRHQWPSASVLVVGFIVQVSLS